MACNQNLRSIAPAGCNVRRDEEGSDGTLDEGCRDVVKIDYGRLAVVELGKIAVGLDCPGLKIELNLVALRLLLVECHFGSAVHPTICRCLGRANLDGVPSACTIDGALNLYFDLDWLVYVGIDPELGRESIDIAFGHAGRCDLVLESVPRGRPSSKIDSDRKENLMRNLYDERQNK